MLGDRECFEESKEEFRSVLRGCGLVVNDDEQLFEYYKGIHSISKSIAAIVATWSELFQRIVEAFQEVSRQLSGQAIQEVMDFEKSVEELRALFNEAQKAEKRRKPRNRIRGKKSSYPVDQLWKCNRVCDHRRAIRKRHHKHTPRAPPAIP